MIGQLSSQVVDSYVGNRGWTEIPLRDFWSIPPEQRTCIILKAISAVHSWHYEHNPAYRYTVTARGVGEAVEDSDFPRLLRPTAQTFKSYIDILSTPFPNDKPQAFLNWMADQLSIELPRERFAHFRKRYSSQEGLLVDFERIFSDFRLHVLTSSGTSGRATIMVRDQLGIDKMVESFYLSFQRFIGMEADHRAVFIMPRKTRIAMVRMASTSVRQVGIPEDRIHFMIPFPALPDHVRIRAGRTYRSGWSGFLERRAYHPVMVWMNERLVNPRVVQKTVSMLKKIETSHEKLLLFGSWVHLHAVALELKRIKWELRLPRGSLVGTGGGVKEFYPVPTNQIRQDLTDVFLLEDGEPIPVRDVYGMAEGNWAAMQCSHGNYHLPPWIYAVTLDNDDHFQMNPDSTGMLAFFDPFGGGTLFPSFFKTSDQVRLVQGYSASGSSWPCPCGEENAYLGKESIQRMDLMDEAGCGAQL